MTASDQPARDVFVDLADTLVADFDVIDFLDMLARRCVELLGVAAAGVLLADQRGTLNLVAASTEKARMLELFQLQNQEGPCLDCYVRRETVRCPDLAATLERWPSFAPAARDAGFTGVYALPMHLRDKVIGGVNLFTHQLAELDDDVLRLGQALANVATIGILHERAIRHHETVVEQLQTALNSRILVEQAKGVVAERLHIAVADAFVLLRDYARHGNRRLAEVAAAVVDGTADVPGIASVHKRRTTGEAPKQPG